MKEGLDGCTTGKCLDHRQVEKWRYKIYAQHVFCRIFLSLRMKWVNDIFSPHRVALRLSYANIVMILEEMFDEPLTPSQATKYLQDMAQEHIPTEGWMIQQLLESPFLHVDETSLNIDYLNKYVWVFTNGKICDL